jgi:hypothetical protein
MTKQVRNFMFLYFLREVVAPPLEITTVETIVCEEFDDDW